MSIRSSRACRHRHAADEDLPAVGLELFPERALERHRCFRDPRRRDQSRRHRCQPDLRQLALRPAATAHRSGASARPWPRRPGGRRIRACAGCWPAVSFCVPSFSRLTLIMTMGGSSPIMLNIENGAAFTTPCGIDRRHQGDRPRHDEARHQLVALVFGQCREVDEHDVVSGQARAFAPARHACSARSRQIRRSQIAQMIVHDAERRPLRRRAPSARRSARARRARTRNCPAARRARRSASSAKPVR